MKINAKKRFNIFAICTQSQGKRDDVAVVVGVSVCVCTKDGCVCIVYRKQYYLQYIPDCIIRYFKYCIN